MCNRHSFSLTRRGKVLHGYGITDSHTIIHQLAGLKNTEDRCNQYEWQPTKGWPDAEWSYGLTVDREVFAPKATHLRTMEKHIRDWYPDMRAWKAPDAVRPLPEGLKVGGSLYLSGTRIAALPEGLTVGGGLYLNCGYFRTVEQARAALAKVK